MAEVVNKLQTRIALKYDTLANWEASSIILKKGEIAIVEFENQHIMAGDHKPANTPPAVSMKVGDGEKTFNQLPYVQAIAGDVYNWAKQAEKPVYIAGEISGIDEYIEERERDTKYVLTEDADKRAFVIKEVDKTGAATGTTYTIDWSDIDTEIQGVKDALKKLEEETMPNAINAAIEDLDSEDAVEYDETRTAARKFVVAVDTADGIAKPEKAALVKEDIPDIEQSQVIGLKKAFEDMEAAYKAADEVVLQAAKDYADEHVGNLENSLAVPEGTYKAATGKMVDDIYEEKGLVKVKYRDLTTLEVKSVDENGAVAATTLKDELDDINAELVRLEADKQDNLPFIGATEGAVPSVNDPVVLKSFIQDIAVNGIKFRGVVDALPPVDDYEQGDLIIVNAASGAVEYVLAKGEDGAKWYELGDEGVHATKAEVKALSDRHDQEMDDLEKKHDDELDALEAAYKKADEDTLAAANKYTDDELGNLDFSAAANGAAAHKFVASFDQEDGLIKNVTFAQPVIDDVDGLPAAIEALQKADADLEANKQDNLVFTNNDYDGANNPVATKKYVDDEIKAAVNDVDFGVDGRDEDTLLQAAEGATETTEYKVLVGFDVEDGALKEGSVVSQKISQVAVTGNVHDLIQTEVLFLDCGSASTVI